MQLLNKLKITSVFFLLLSNSYAQEPIDTNSTGYVYTNETSPKISPAIIGKPKSKAFAVSYGLIPGLPITSESELSQFDGSNETIERLEEIKMGLRVPLLVKKRTKLILGLKYQYEEFNFVNKDKVTNAIFKNLQNKHLTSLGADFYLKQSIGKRNFTVIRFGTDLNGDYDAREISAEDVLKFTFGAIYGVEKDSLNSYGVGVYLDYSFGRPVIYPTIMWNKWLTNRLSFDALIPAKFTLRYAASEKDIIKTGYYLDGGSYNIAVDESSLNNIPTLQLRRSGIRLKIEYEREIYKFLWFDFKTGYEYNLKFDVAEENTYKKDELIQNNVSGSIFFEIGIFFVPPKKFVKNYRNSI